VPKRPGIDKIRTPRIGNFSRAWDCDERIVGARHHDAAKWQGAAGNRRKTANMVRCVIHRFDVGRRHQQGRLDGQVGTFGRNMRHQGAAEAVCDQNGAGRSLNGGSEAFDPRVAIGRVPIVLLNTRRAGKRSLQVGLPMMRARAAKAGDDENGRHR